MKCNHCNGTGKVVQTTTILFEKKVIGKTNMCCKCYGEGKLNWIESITGKKKFDRKVLFDNETTVVDNAKSR